MHIYAFLIGQLLEPDELFAKALIVSPCTVVWAHEAMQTSNSQLHGCMVGWLGAVHMHIRFAQWQVLYNCFQLHTVNVQIFMVTIFLGLNF